MQGVNSILKAGDREDLGNTVWARMWTRAWSCIWGLGAGTGEEPTSCLSYLQVFSFQLSFWLGVFFQPRFSGTFHVLTTCVTWSPYQGGSHVSLLPTKGKAFGHLLPVIPIYFLDSEPKSSFLSSSPTGPRGTSRGSARKAVGGSGGKRRLRWFQEF